MEEKKKYINPKIETIMIELGDVVTTSPNDPGGELEPIIQIENESENNDQWNSDE